MALCARAFVFSSRPVLNWLDTTPRYLVGIILLVLMLAAAAAGVRLRARLEFEIKSKAPDKWHHDYDGYLISAVLGLLALLLGFTFSLATSRYEERRQMVVAEANAIGTAYLRVQLLGAPHRQRLSQMLIEFAKVETYLGKARDKPETQRLLIEQDKRIDDMWAATAAAFDSVRTISLSLAIVQAMNDMFDLGAARRAARFARVPIEVFAVLFVYLIGAAAVLGYVLAVGRGWVAAAFLLALLNLSFLVVLDIDRPTSGGILESQQPMDQMLVTLQNQPPGTFDRWR